MLITLIYNAHVFNVMQEVATSSLGGCVRGVEMINDLGSVSIDTVIFVVV